MTEQALPPSTPITRCENCDTPLDGPFCGKCGQPKESIIKFFGSVIVHFLDDIMGYDARAWRTLFPLFFRPGFLTNKYIEGKRVRYVPPFRLYLFISIVFFIFIDLTLDRELDNQRNQESKVAEISQAMKESIQDELYELNYSLENPEVGLTDENKSHLAERKTLLNSRLSTINSTSDEDALKSLRRVYRLEDRLYRNGNLSEGQQQKLMELKQSLVSGQQALFPSKIPKEPKPDLNEALSAHLSPEQIQAIGNATSLKQVFKVDVDKQQPVTVISTDLQGNPLKLDTSSGALVPTTIKDPERFIEQLHSNLPQIELQLDNAVAKKMQEFIVIAADASEEQRRNATEQRLAILAEHKDLRARLRELRKTNTKQDQQVLGKIYQLEYQKAFSDDFSEQESQQLETLKSSWEDLQDHPLEWIIDVFDGLEQLDFDSLTEDQNLRLKDQFKQIKDNARYALREDSSPLVKQVLAELPKLMFLLLPLFALFLKIIYPFSKRFYMEHLMVAFHSHGFIFFALMILTLFELAMNSWFTDAQWLKTVLDPLGAAVLLWIPVYLFWMQKSVYRQGWFMTTFKYMITGFSYLMLMIMTSFLALLWGLASVGS